MKKKYSEEKYPLLSFIVPVYGDEHTIEEMVDSVMSQDYPNIEIIISVDGCKKSEKVVRKIVKKYEKSTRRCIALYAKKNSGACVARNEGAKLADGKFFSFLPADAKLFPGVARIWMRHLRENPDYDFVYGGYRFREEWISKKEVQKLAKAQGVSFEQYINGASPNKEGKYLARPEQNYFGDMFDPYMLEVSNYIDGSFPLKAEMFWKVGGWDPKIKSLQDWDLWLAVVKAGGKGLYARDIYFDTEYPHAGGLSDDSHKNWLDRTKQIKKKHGIPDRKICVNSLGAPFHGKRIARILDADFKEMPSFKPHEYEMIYQLGFFASMSDVAAQVFINARGKKVIHWIGSDIWQMQQADLRSRQTLLSFFNSTIDEHLCEADFTQKELKELGIDAKIVPLPPRFFYKANPLPEKFTVGVYMPGNNQAFYLPDVCKKVAELMPDIEFKFFGDSGTVGRINNIEYKGYVSDMQSLIDECSMIMRLTVHDGLPLSVVEFLSAGRHALTSVEMKHTDHAFSPNPDALVRQLQQLKRKINKEGLNKKGAQYYRKVCSHATYKHQIGKIMKYNPKEYWENRAEGWSQQADAGYSLSQKDWDKIKGALKSIEFDSVLDLGCGNGRFVPMFDELEKQYTGIDISKKLVDVAKKRYPGYKFRELTVENIPSLRKKFDLAFSFTTLEHITEENWEKAITALKKVAKYGVFIEPTGFSSLGHCHDHDYKKDFKVISTKTIGDKKLFIVDLTV